jgi:hypothetical protein
MAKIGEADTGGFPINEALDQGLKLLSGSQEITFKQYTRAVLPLDGYVFWVLDTAVAPIQVSGSLHYDTDQQQRVDEIIGINHVIFTTTQEIDQFNSIAGNSAWIGEIDQIRFAFTSRGRIYKQAEIYHYRGDAIYPTMYSQIIDNPANPVNLGGLIATNSMPIWLGLNQYMELYPAFLVNSNIRPPYAAVQISETHPLQGAPFVDGNGSSWQLMTERVKIIMHGLRNDEAVDFLRYVMDYSMSGDVLGLQNLPGIVDEQRGQSELGILAQKKSIEFEVNYYQTRVQQVARKMISAAGINIASTPFGLIDQTFVLDQTLLAH